MLGLIMFVVMLDLLIFDMMLDLLLHDAMLDLYMCESRYPYVCRDTFLSNTLCWISLCIL
jgi:hypothetical protein